MKSQQKEVGPSLSQRSRSVLYLGLVLINPKTTNEGCAISTTCTFLHAFPARAIIASMSLFLVQPCVQYVLVDHLSKIQERQPSSQQARMQCTIYDNGKPRTNTPQPQWPQTNTSRQLGSLSSRLEWRFRPRSDAGGGRDRDWSSNSSSPTLISTSSACSSRSSVRWVFTIKKTTQPQQQHRRNC